MRAFRFQASHFILLVLFAIPYSLFAQTLSGGASLSGAAMNLPAPCGPGTILQHANTNCTLDGSIYIAYGSANGIYNPSGGDCVISGTGPTCPTQSQLSITPDCTTGGPMPGCTTQGGGINATRLIGFSGFNFSCSGACSMTLQIHSSIQYANEAGARLPNVGGTGNFTITSSQTIDGTQTTTATCTSNACGTANFPACLTTSPYCMVNGNPISFTAGPHTELTTISFNCSSGACSFEEPSVGDHDYPAPF